MRFIIYWVTYLSSLNATPVEIAGVVTVDVDNKKLTTYIHDAGYVDWDIDHIDYSVLQDIPSRRKNQIDRCLILAHKDDIRMTTYITFKYVRMEIKSKEVHERIQYKRKL